MMYGKAGIISKRRHYLLGWATITAIMLLLYVGGIWNSESWGFVSFTTSRATTETMLMITIFMMCSFTFDKFRDPRSAATEMMLPVSVNEKFVFHLLFCFIVIPFVLFSTFLFVDGIFSLLYDQTWLLITKINNFHLYGSGGILLIPAIMSVFFYGSILFRRQPLLMTIISLFVSIILLIWIFNTVGLFISTEDNVTINRLMTITFSAVLLILMLGLAYRRFRNFQITK